MYRWPARDVASRSTTLSGNRYRPSGYLPPPRPRHSWIRAPRESDARAAGLVDLLPVTYTIEGNTLLASETLKEYLPDEIYDRIGPLLREKPGCLPMDRQAVYPINIPESKETNLKNYSDICTRFANCGIEFE